MPDLGNRLNNFRPSEIAEIFSLATRLREQGEDIADLSTGEPDFDTDKRVCQAAREAIDQGQTRYTPVDGTTALKCAIRNKFKTDNQLDYGLDEIIVDSGAKPLLAHAMLAMLNAGDEVIVPTPCWPCHPGVVQLYGAYPVFVRGSADHDFKLQPQDLEHAITGKTRAIILNSPANPSGAVYSAGELRALAEVLLLHRGIWILSDDIYEKLRYDGREFATMARIEPGLKDRTITINGLSKAFAMTGWRIGYAGGPPELMAAIRKIMTQATGCPGSINQAAAVAALTGEQDYVARQVSVFQARRDRMVEALNQAQGLSVTACQGAFYLYVNCEGVIGKHAPDGTEIGSSTDFARFLLETYKVAVVPGAAFEYDPYFRISFGTSDQQLDIAGQRIIQACESLMPA